MKTATKIRLLEMAIFAVLIAIGVAAWPAAQCALGQCGVRDLWCAGDCSRTCVPTTRLGIVAHSNAPLYNNACTWAEDLSSGMGYCVENFLPDYVGVQCDETLDPDGCNVTTVLEPLGEWSEDAATFLLFQDYRLWHDPWNNDRSYWYVAGCEIVAPKSCALNRAMNKTPVTCCVGMAACTPQYNPPTIALGSQSPTNPIVYGQDPDRLRFDAVISVTGGGKSNTCTSGAANQNVTSISVTSVTLSEATVDWITGLLALRYPGAYIKGSYPLMPSPILSGIGTANATASIHVDPLDPGYYVISVTAIQEDGQTTTADLTIPVFMLDSTITLPAEP